MQFGFPIPEEILNRAEGDARAEPLIDFPRTPVRVNISAGNDINANFGGSITILDDTKNEAPEIFLLLVEISEETSNAAEAPIITFVNEGLSIARIVDEDEVGFQFEQPVYIVSESDGDLPDTVRLVRDVDTELVYRFNIGLRSGDTPATPGRLHPVTALCLIISRPLCQMKISSSWRTYSLCSQPTSTGESIAAAEETGSSGDKNSAACFQRCMPGLAGLQHTSITTSDLISC
jgi:hypothetical protein